MKVVTRSCGHGEDDYTREIVLPGCLVCHIERLRHDVKLGEEAVCLLQEVMLLEGIEKRGQFYALDSLFEKIREYLTRK
jgi:hypothetical protein